MSKPENKNGWVVEVDSTIRMDVVLDPGYDRYAVRVVCVVDGLELATSVWKNPMKCFLEAAESAVAQLRAKIENDEVHN